MSSPSDAIAAFDGLADTYDASFTRSAVGRALRDIVWSRAQEAFQMCGSVLELGCGTGEDAVRLAQLGVHVVAIDSSPQMLRVAIDKARRTGCADAIEFRCMAMEEVRNALDGRCFDGVFSNFGAINCVRDLSSLVADVAARLAPGAPLLWVVMGKYAPWEWAWHLARGNWRKSARRLRSDGVEWRGLTIRYPTPAQLTAILQPQFSIDRLTPLGVALPPSYAAAWLDRSPRALKTFEALEKLARRSSALAALADHYIVEATHSHMHR